MSNDKECFFIAPIGDEGSEIRERTNKLMEYIVEEALSEYNYTVKRADQLDDPGSITSQVIEKTVNSELVIADLTGHNPNVFYELAVRHATGEPFIQLIESTETIPFDIADIRTIKYGLEVEEAEKAKDEIQSQIDRLQEGDPEFDNPISRSAEMESLRQSSDPADQNLAEIMETISTLDRKMENMERMMKDSQNESTLADRSSKNTIEIQGNKYAIEQPADNETIEIISEEQNIPKQKIIKELSKSGIAIKASTNH